MIRPITRADEAEVRNRVGNALSIEPGEIALGWGAAGLRSIHGSPGDARPGLYAGRAYAALAAVGIFQGIGGWEIETGEDPAFPTDGGAERPVPPSGWYPTFFVPDRATCPFCGAPVIPCAIQHTDGPPCRHARWKPAPSAHGARFAHTECVEAADALDGAAKACREWEEAKAEEIRAWELAKLATELRLRAEKTYQEAMSAKGMASS